MGQQAQACACVGSCVTALESLHIPFTPMLFSPARKHKTFCSNPSCLVQHSLLSFPGVGYVPTVLMQKCQPQSSQVPTCTSAPPLCRGKGHPWTWQCLHPAAMCGAHNWCKEIGNIFLFWAELWLHHPKIASLPAKESTGSVAIWGCFWHEVFSFVFEVISSSSSIVLIHSHLPLNLYHRERKKKVLW